MERAGGLFVGELRQVRRYLLDPELKTKADARVAETVGGDGRILIGHSLGSVVAVEFLRQHPGYRLDLLITLGSPLGLRAIRHLMPDPEYGCAEGVPANVGAWVNLRDLQDPVACAGSLRRWWPGIREGIVDNQKSAHSVERYLSKKETGDAVLSVAPELAW
jgi:pimeloyl-ACP methyl ester carboxylesterase